MRDLADELYPGQAAINHMAERNYCPYLRVKRFKEPKLDSKAPTREWLEVYRSVTDPWDAALARFMYETGARISEAIHPHLQIDLKNRIATLNGKYVKNGDKRTFYLTEGMAEELKELPRLNGQVFGYHDRYRPLKVRRKICKEHGLEYFHLHGGGRHGFATEMVVRNGVDVVTTAKAGGWKTTRVLLENYVHAEGIKNAVEDTFKSVSQSRSRHSKIQTIPKRSTESKG